MQAACDIAFEYAHHREAFGQKIGTYQVSFFFVFIVIFLSSDTSANIFMRRTVGTLQSYIFVIQRSPMFFDLS